MAEVTDRSTQCAHQYIKGANRGHFCGRIRATDSEYCGEHQKCKKHVLYHCISIIRDTKEPCNRLTASANKRCGFHQYGKRKVVKNDIIEEVNKITANMEDLKITKAVIE